MFDVLGKQGRDFALEAHREVHQLYDGYLPYEFHLRLAAKTAMDFIGTVTTNARESNIIVGATWCHDVLEDTFRTYNDLRKGVGDEVADIVYAVTNEKGKTRKERANARYYQGIKAVPNATFVKLADRIANVTYGKVFGGSMYKVYQREQEDFEKALAGPELEQLRPMLIHLRSLLR